MSEGKQDDNANFKVNEIEELAPNVSHRRDLLWLSVIYG